MPQKSKYAVEEKVLLVSEYIAGKMSLGECERRYGVKHRILRDWVRLQLAAGVDVRTLQARSGHANATTLLNVYSHAIQSAQERAAQVMDDVLARNDKNKNHERLIIVRS